MSEVSIIDIPNFSLNGRIILLTGASGYLGRAMSAAIIDAGATLIISGRRIEALNDVKESLSTSKRDNCHIISGDITQQEIRDSIHDYISDRFGILHGLINNAYAGRVGLISEIGVDDFFMGCNYNLTIPFMLTKALLPLLERGAQKTEISSSVVNVASMYGIVSPNPAVYGDSGQNNPVHYGATKAGLIQMTRYFACHLSSSGIRFNSISPGPFPNENIPSEIPNFYESLATKVPMKRIGKPHEVAGPVVFLLSDASSYVNGINLSVDGGWTAW